MSIRSTVSFEVGTPEWTALATIINDGVELPPTIAVELAPNSLAAVTLRWIEVKVSRKKVVCFMFGFNEEKNFLFFLSMTAVHCASDYGCAVDDDR